MTIGLNLKLITEKYMEHFHILPIKQTILNNWVKETYKNIAHGVIMKKCVSNPVYYSSSLPSHLKLNNLILKPLYPLHQG